jgi:serine/threonine-protein kinase
MNVNLPTHACDSERLESFLSGDLSEAEEREFTVHLNSCESCRRSLADQAAEPEAWREAEMLLKPSQFDSQIANELTNRSAQPLQIQYVLDAISPTDDPEMLGRLGSYEVSGVVGAGGMGVVLKAIDRSLDRTVAIKVLTPHLASSGSARKRFAREAKAAAAVLHPNVIAIHSVSNDETALPYLVMPYVRGTSLQKRLDREGPLPLREILRIAAQIAAGLAAAHAQGLVHRDIKPANILLEEGVERVTITDFGLARAVDDATITHSGMIAGTPQYMSPEQARGEALDPRSDLFSLGSVMYAICTGRPPFRAETSYGVLRRITDEEPKAIREINPDIPQWLCQIISKLMSKRAADRYESAAEVAELLEACLAHVQQPTVAKLPPFLQLPAKGGRFFSISRRWAGVIAMVAAFGLGLLGILAWQTTEAPDIAGKWSGEEWGDVVLKKTAHGEYLGTYSDTFNESPGTIEVQWSRLEHRYKGAWREGQDRSGKISLRLVDNEIRGAWTTSRKSEINPGTPELADLTWKRMDTPKANAEGGIRVQVLLSTERHSRELLRKNIGFDGLSIMGSGITGTVNGKAHSDIVAVMAHRCRLESFDETQLGGKMYWRAILLVPQDSKSDGANHTLSQKRIDQMQEQGVQFWLDHQRDEAAAKPAALSEKLRSTNGTSPATPAAALETEIQVKVAAPEKMVMEAANQQGQFDGSLRLVVPARLNLRAGKTYRLKLTNIAGREGAEFYPTVETGPTSPRTEAFWAHNSVPIQFTEEEFDQALAGNHVTKVIYLPDPDFQEFALAGVETLVSTRLDPGTDPVREATRRGSILAVIRLGNRDAELPGAAPTPAKTKSEGKPQRIRQFSIPRRIGAIACSPDGKLIAIANSIPLTADSKPVVDILDTKTGTTVASLPFATDEEREVLTTIEDIPEFEVGPLVFSPDGAVLAVSNALGQVKLFKARSGELIRSLDDEKAKLAEEATPEKLRSLSRAMGGVRSLAFSPDGSLLATCGDSFVDAARIWGRIERGGLGQRSSTGPGRLKVWDAKTGALKHDLSGHSHAFAVAFAPDGPWLASAGRWSTASSDGNGVLLWDLEKGAIHRTILIEANGATHSVVFSPQTKLAAAGSIIFDKENDTRSAAILVAYPLSGITEWQQTIQGAAMPKGFLPDGKSIVVLCERKSIRFLDAETGESKHEIKAADSELWIDLAIAPKAGLMVVAVAGQEQRGGIEVWNITGRGSDVPGQKQ